MITTEAARILADDLSREQVVCYTSITLQRPLDSLLEQGNLIRVDGVLYQVKQVESEIFSTADPTAITQRLQLTDPPKE